VAKSENISLVDKFQAEKELVICRRKLAYWARMIDLKELETALAEQHKRWGGIEVQYQANQARKPTSIRR
jgi:hypothetical protein